jgi:inosine-uridine nucleoside N-ribohydrolase
MQFPAEEKPPVGIAFDSDLGNSIDDILALALLYGLENRKPSESRLISLSVTKSNLKAAAFCEAVDRFYSQITSRQIPERFRRDAPPPIGLSLDGKMAADTPLLTAPLSKQDKDGKPLYAHQIHKPTDTADAAALIRNGFTAQFDQNAIVVLTGPATNLAHVLDLKGAKELIAAKVRFLAVAAGTYPSGPADSAIQTDIPAARQLFAEWPTPIVAVSSEVGEQARFPGAVIEKGFPWAPSHPIIDAYKAFQPMPYDAPTTSLAAALYAVRPEEGYFQLSEPGTITVAEDGGTKFTPSADGKHRYLTLDPAKQELVVKTYADIVSAEPAPRELPRFLRRLLEEEKKKEEEKKLLEQKQQQQ